MATNLIIKLGLEARANELRNNPENTIREIARILSEESGKTIQPNSVQRYFSKPDAVVQKVQQRTEVIQQAVQERLDTLQQLRDINQDTLDILKKAKDAKKGGDYLALAAIQRIEKQLELQAKLLGDLPTQPTVNITLVENQFNEFKTAVLGVMCPDCQRRLAELLRARVGA